MNNKTKPTVKKEGDIWVVKHTNNEGENFEFRSEKSASHAINNWYLLFGEKTGLRKGG
jgi:hypothetical protein